MSGIALEPRHVVMTGYLLVVGIVLAAKMPSWFESFGGRAAQHILMSSGGTCLHVSHPFSTAIPVFTETARHISNLVTEQP